MATWSPPQCAVVSAPLLSSSPTAVQDDKVAEQDILSIVKAGEGDGSCNGFDEAFKVIEDLLADLKDVGESPISLDSKQQVKTAECHIKEKKETESKIAQKEQQSLSSSKEGIMIVPQQQKSHQRTNKDSMTTASGISALQETESEIKPDESIKTKSSWRNYIGKAAVGFKERFKKKQPSKETAEGKEEQHLLQQAEEKQDDKDIDKARGEGDELTATPQKDMIPILQAKEGNKLKTPQKDINGPKTTLFEKAEDNWSKAIYAGTKGDYHRAHLEYMIAKSLFDAALKKSDEEPLSEDMKKTAIAKRDRCLERAVNLRQFLIRNDPQRFYHIIKQVLLVVPKVKPKYETEGPFIWYKPSIKMYDDVAGAVSARKVLERTVLIPLKFPDLCDSKLILTPYKSVLLYGPTGVGKTHLAKALATEIDATFIYVNTFGILSRGLARQIDTVFARLFDLACKNKPSVVFIDDIDFLFPTQGIRIELSNCAKVEFLLQMQKLSVSSDEYNGVIIVGSTNAPWKLEPAVLKRFVKKLYVPLPDEESRQKLIEIHLGDIPNDLKENEKKELAAKTHLCSSANIVAAVREGLMEPLRVCMRAKAFKFEGKVVDGKLQYDFFAPCSPSDPDAINMTWRDVPQGKLIVGNVTLSDFLKPFDLICIRVSSQELKQYDTFVKEHGEEDEEKETL